MDSFLHYTIVVLVWPLRAFVRLLGAVMLLGLSLLPLASLLLMLPAIVPQETVLSESNRASRSFWWSLPGRILSVLAGLTMLVALVAFGVTLVSVLPIPSSGYFEDMLRGPVEAAARMGNNPLGWLGQNILANTPEAFFRYWPYVIVIVYLTDLLFLAGIGRVPLRYNVRNLTVRWPTTLLTAVAFTVVVGLLTSLLAFVNGMNDLTANSGIPGNVIVLSDGATDELLSTLQFGNVDQIGLERVTLDSQDRPLKTPVTVKDSQLVPGEKMLSKETYFVINQPIPNQGEGPERRRFVQARGIENPLIASEVHAVGLLPGGQWFSESGVDGEGRYQAVLGEGIAQTLGEDVGKPSLVPGDTFELGDNRWVVTGIMDSEGTTVGSEIWGKWRIMADLFNKQQYTTVVLRVHDDSIASAEAMAYHLSNRFQLMKVKAMTEKAYFSNLESTNDTFLIAILFVVAIMALGGIFGVMNTMFAAISQRIRDIGVLRIIGFKRWQILVSFMLESLVIALVGGLVGCALGYLVDGFTANSILSSGAGGGGKMVVLTIRYDLDIFMCGVLFTLVMGRLGGLLPALSAMRLRLLDSLR